MNGSAEEPVGEPDQVDPPAGTPSADPLLEKRAKQASKLTATAETLIDVARRLRRGFPPDDQHPLAFWKRGLDTVKGHLEDVGTLHEDCELLVKQMSEAKQAADAVAVDDESKANGEDADQMELETLSEGLVQLDDAIAHAAQVTRKAMAAVRGNSTDDEREDAYFAAAGELAEIAGHCQGLGDQLKGEPGLPGSGPTPRSLSAISSGSWTHRTRFRILGGVGRISRSSAAAAIIAVPADLDTRVDFGLQRVRLHARALDRELERLARGNYRGAGQWASRAAVPIVRTVCITRYLAVAADRPAVTAEERRRRRYLDQAREELRSALSATARSLSRLGDPAIGMAERQEVLAELPRYRTRQRHFLGTLDELLDQATLHLALTSDWRAGRRAWRCRRRACGSGAPRSVRKNDLPAGPR